MSQLLNARISQLEDELRDARRTIDTLERRDTFLREESKRQTDGLKEDLLLSRQDRDRLRDAVNSRHNELMALRGHGEEQTREIEKLRGELQAKAQAGVVDVQFAEKLVGELKDEEARRKEVEGRLAEAVRRQQETDERLREEERRREVAEEMMRREKEALEAVIQVHQDAEQRWDEFRRRAEGAFRAKEKPETDHEQTAYASQQIRSPPAPPPQQEGDNMTVGRTVSDGPSSTADTDKQQRGAERALQSIKTDDIDCVAVNSKVPRLPKQVHLPAEVIEISDEEEIKHSTTASPSHVHPPSSVEKPRSSMKQEKPVPLPIRPEKRPLEATPSVDPFSSDSPLTTSANSATPAPPPKRQKVETQPVASPSSSVASRALVAGPSASCRKPDALRNTPASLHARAVSYSSVSAPAQTPAPAPPLRHAGYPGYIRRDFLSATYGGNPQSFVTTIKAARNISSKKCDRRLLFPLWEQNPGLPDAPGRPGTLIANRFDMLHYDCISTFVRAPDVAAWRYVGNYKLKKSDTPISPQEFKSMPDQTRMKWATDILRPQCWECYTSMRARVWLRKNGREVTDEAVRAALRPKAKATELGLVPADMLKALDSGEEVLNVLLCIPISYDADFQDDLTARYAEWEAKGKLAKPNTGKAKTSKPTSHRTSDPEDCTDDDNEAPVTVGASHPQVRRSARRCQGWAVLPDEEESGEDVDLLDQDDDEDYRE